MKEGQFQYRLVNWEKYQAIKNEAERREYNRVKQAEYRAKSKPARGEQRAAKAYANGDEKTGDAIAAREA